MKKILTICLFLVISNYVTFGQDWGFFSVDRSSITIDFNTAQTTYSVYSGGVGTFNGSNLGTFSSNTQTLSIASWYVKTYKNNGGDVTGVDMKYRIYKQGATPGVFISTGGSWIQDLGGGDQKWGKTTSSSIDITTLDFSSTYYLEVYIEAYGTNPTLTKYDNNSGSNYIASFLTNATFPVELTSFSASVKNKNVNLVWHTATEVNNYGFEIEKRQSSTANGQWSKIGFVNGYGNSNSVKEYSFTDKTGASGKYNYRLKQIDNDGKYEYSKEVEVDLGKPTTFALNQNYPNPFNPSTSIQYSVAGSQYVSLKVFNVLGKEVAVLVNEKKESGTYTVDFTEANLSGGAYFYRLQAGDFVQTKKMILLK